MSDLKLPNLVLAGVTKAGTTSLFAYLAQHPEVCAADRKDINHYSPMRYGKQPPPLADYAAPFGHCSGQRWRLDASPDYFTGGAPLAERMAEELPECRVLFTLRNPTTRLWSSYRYKKSLDRVDSDMTFQAFLDELLDAKAKGLDLQQETEHFRTLMTGEYGDHLEPWLDVFGDRAKVIFFEHLAEDARSSLHEVADWLDLDREAIDRIDTTAHNKTVNARSDVLKQVANRVNEAGEQFFRRFPRLESRLREAYWKLNSGEAEEMTRDEQRQVDTFYADSNRRVHELLTARGYTNFPKWVLRGAGLLTD